LSLSLTKWHAMKASLA